MSLAFYREECRLFFFLESSCEEETWMASISTELDDHMTNLLFISEEV